MSEPAPPDHDQEDKVAQEDLEDPCKSEPNILDKYDKTTTPEEGYKWLREDIKKELTRKLGPLENEMNEMLDWIKLRYEPKKRGRKGPPIPVVTGVDDDLTYSFIPKLWETITELRQAELFLSDVVTRLLEKLYQKHEEYMARIEIEKGLESKIEDKNKEIDDLLRQLDIAQEREVECHTRLDLSRQMTKLLRDDIQAIKDEQTQLDLELGISPANKEAYLAERAKLKIDIKKLKHQLKRVEGTTGALMTRIRSLEEEKSTLEGEKKNITNQYNEVSLKLLSTTDALQKTAADLEVASRNYRSVIDDCTATKRNLKEKDKKLTQAELKVIGLEAEKSKLTSVIKSNLLSIQQLHNRIRRVTGLYKQVSASTEFHESLKTSFKFELKAIEKSQKALFARLSGLVKQRQVAYDEVQAMSKKLKECHVVIEGKSTTISQLNGTINALNQHIEVMGRELIKAIEQADSAYGVLYGEKKTKSILIKEVSVLDNKLQTCKAALVIASRDRDKYSNENQILTKKIDLVQNELRRKLNEVGRLQEEKLEKDAEIEKNNIMYKAAMNAKEVQLMALNRCKTQLVISHSTSKEAFVQVRQIQEEVAINERETKKLQREVRQKNSTIFRLNSELGKCRQQLKIARQTIKNMTIEEIAMKRKSQHVADQSKSGGSSQEQLIAESCIIATQLDRRTAELGALHSKLETMESVLRLGENEYNKRLDDIKILKIEVSKLKSEKQLLEKAYKSSYELRGEIFRLVKELNQEKLRSRALQNEMANPVNLHRWRIIEKTDPDKHQLIIKITVLQKQISVMNKQKMKAQLRLEEVEELYKNIKASFERLPGLEASSYINRLNKSVRDKTASLKGKEAEIMAIHNELQRSRNQFKSSQEELCQLKQAYLIMREKLVKHKIPFSLEVSFYSRQSLVFSQSTLSFSDFPLEIEPYMMPLWEEILAAEAAAREPECYQRPQVKNATTQTDVIQPQAREMMFQPPTFESDIWEENKFGPPIVAIEEKGVQFPDNEKGQQTDY